MLFYMGKITTTVIQNMNYLYLFFLLTFAKKDTLYIKLRFTVVISTIIVYIYSYYLFYQKLKKSVNHIKILNWLSIFVKLSLRVPKTLLSRY